MDGILNIDKPAGLTSYGAVARVKHLTGERRVGHAGTLDPLATGVLPIFLGKATRLVPYLAGAAKTYRAGVELGAATDTYDITGNIVQRGDPAAIDRAQLDAALGQFRGAILQNPPMYSALKYRGQPLYKLARAGISVARPGRAVTIFRLEIIDFLTPLVTLEIECSKGTYIRSLAHDLGQVLGCGACLKSLRRTRFGPFDIKDAVNFSQLGDGARFLIPTDLPLRDYRALVIDEAAEKSLRQGKNVVLEETGGAAGERCRAYATDGRFLGMVRYLAESGFWRAERLFS